MNATSLDFHVNLEIHLVTKEKKNEFLTTFNVKGEAFKPGLGFPRLVALETILQPSKKYLFDDKFTFYLKVCLNLRFLL